MRHGPNCCGYSFVSVDGRGRSKKRRLGEKWWRVESAGVKARGKDNRCTLDKAAWTLPETGSWRTSPVLWLDFPWVAGGRLQVDQSFFFPPSPLSLHTHHAEPVPVTMVTQGEPCHETVGCKQKRDPLSHFRNLQGGGSPPTPPMEMDQRSQNSVAFNSVLHLRCWWGIEHLLFCACMCFYKSLQYTAVQTQMIFMLTFSLFYLPLRLFIFFCFQIIKKKLINTIKQKSWKSKAISFAAGNGVCRRIYFQTTCRIRLLWAHKRETMSANQIR